MLIDSHCHLDCEDFENDLEEIIERAKKNGVTAMLNAGNDFDKIDDQLKLLDKYPFIFNAVGVHPHNAEDFANVTADDIIAKTNHKKVVAIGETGLDYFYDYSPKEVQIKLFIEHIKAAQETGLPLIIHTRNADDDTIRILAQEYEKKPFTGEIHCFSSSKELADFALSIGFYISASGMITFNKAQEIRDIFANIPEDRLLVETDAPFLAPIPKRGKRNEPSYVKYTLEKLAQIKEIDEDKLAQITSDNFYKLFRKASDKGRYNY